MTSSDSNTPITGDGEALRFALIHGQYDTRHKPLKSNGDQNPRYDQPYQTISYSAIKARVVSPPPFVSKDQTDGVMPHDYHDIDLREAVPDDTWRYQYLSTDLDTGDHPKEVVVQAVSTALGDDSEFCVYSTGSAWTDKVDPATGEVTNRGARWATLVPLQRPLKTLSYVAFAKAFLEALEQQGLTVDHTTAQLKRIRYLPVLGNGGYDYHIHEGPFFRPTDAHPMMQRAVELLDDLTKAQLARKQRYADQVKREGPFSLIAAYRRKHPTTPALMEWLGFDTQDGIYWHHRDQGSDTYATELHDDGSLHTLSGTVGAMGGNPTEHGKFFSDTYDIFRHVTFKGRSDMMTIYAKQCLEEYPNPVFQWMVAMGKATWAKYEAKQQAKLSAIVDRLTGKAAPPETKTDPETQAKYRAIIETLKPKVTK